MRRASLILNPSSGHGDAAEEERAMRAILGRELVLDVVHTAPERDGTAAAREALERGAELVIASGGDGTVSRVAAALVDTGVPLAIVPRGTANSIAAALGSPAELEAACANALTGDSYLVDTARVNGRVALLFAAVGFHADTISGAEREAKARWGVGAYLMSALEQLAGLEPFRVELELEHAVVRTEAVSVTVAVAAPPGSVLAQGPSLVSARDGLLDVTLVAAESGLELVAASAHLFRTARRREGATRDDVGYLSARRVRITTDPPRTVLVDGDEDGTTPALVECSPRSLSVVLPAAPPERTCAEEKLEGLPRLQIEPRPPRRR